MNLHFKSNINLTSLTFSNNSSKLKRNRSWNEGDFPRSMCFRLLHQVGDDKLAEDGDVPEVDKEEAKVAREEEGKGEDAKVEEGLVVHPGNDGHPDGKGRQVDPRVQLELLGCPIDPGNNVDDPGLVEHRVDLSHQAEDCKSNSIASEQSAGEAEDDEDVVDEELAWLLVPHHVNGLG